jgi:predicted GNAT family N-acyltransferase
MTDDIRIRHASWASQHDALLNIRYRVFVDEQGVPPEMEEDEHDPSALHLLATNKAGEAIGCARLINDGVKGYIGRMAVLPLYRDHGIGTRLLLELLEQARKKHLQQVLLHAQCHAAAFYRQHGFEPVGPEFDEAGIPHQKMSLVLSGPQG